MGWPCPPSVLEVCSKVLPSSVKYFVSTERYLEDKRGFSVSAGWPHLPCVLEVCSKVLPSEVEYYISTDTEVLGGREGDLCPPCVPEVCSKALPSSVKYFVSTEVLGG